MTNLQRFFWAGCVTRVQDLCGHLLETGELAGPGWMYRVSAMVVLRRNFGSFRSEEGLLSPSSQILLVHLQGRGLHNYQTFNFPSADIQFLLKA